MKFPFTVSILGTDYTVVMLELKDDAYLEDKHGYIYYSDRKIIIKNLYKECPDDPHYATERYIKECVRHEIFHAFLKESGLCGCSLQYSSGWAKNEEMIDWLAIQAPKIFEVMRKAKCL